MTDLHQPATDPNQSILQRLSALETSVARAHIEPPNIPVVTALPANPAAGTMIALVDSLTSPTFRWVAVYNPSSSSSYKWEVIGGTPIRGYVDTPESTASAAYVNLTTTGPDAVLPLGGDYNCTWGYRTDSGVAGAVSESALWNANTAQISARDMPVGFDSTSTIAEPSRTELITGLAQGTTVRVRYGASGATVRWIGRYLYAMPVRVG